MIVDEANRSWCTSSNSNDQRAITIEVASDNVEPYAFTPAAYETLTKLVVDICQRNNIKKLVWSTDKNARINHLNGCNLTVHRDYANKSCPGNWMYGKMAEFAAEVNKRLEAAIKPAPKPEPKPEEDYLTTMTEKEFNAILDKRVDELKPVTYKFIEDVPEWGRPSVQKCLDKKFMVGTGTENGKAVLNISADLLRTVVLFDRAGLFN